MLYKVTYKIDTGLFKAIMDITTQTGKKEVINDAAVYLLKRLHGCTADLVTIVDIKHISSRVYVLPEGE